MPELSGLGVCAARPGFCRLACAPPGRLRARWSWRRQLLVCCCCSVVTSVHLGAGALLQLLLCNSAAAAPASNAPRRTAGWPARDALLLRRPPRASSAASPGPSDRRNLRALVLRVSLPSTCAPLYARRPTATAQVGAGSPASGQEAVRCTVSAAESAQPCAAGRKPWLA
jgi:hypothetical protein